MALCVINIQLWIITVEESNSLVDEKDVNIDDKPTTNRLVASGARQSRVGFWLIAVGLWLQKFVMLNATKHL